MFKADYDGGSYRCDKGPCPSGLLCHDGMCVTSLPDDAPMIDAPPIDAPDARIPAFTCDDPGVLPAMGGIVSGSTLGKFSRIAASCGGFVMNGADDVYSIDVPANTQLRVIIEDGREAYVLTMCNANPGTCVENKRAYTSNPILVTVSGTAYVVVDGAAAVPGGDYTLTVERP